MQTSTTRYTGRLPFLLGALLCSTMWLAACGGGGSSSGEGGTSDPDAGGECTPGEVGCACDAGACGDGLTCTNDLCIPSDNNGTTGGTTGGMTGDTGGTTGGTTGGGTTNGMTGDTTGGTTGNTTTPMLESGLSIDSAEARSCELVLLDPDEQVSEVLFNDTVNGREMRRGKWLAIAFHAQEDAEIIQGAVSFNATDFDGLEFTVTRCFDADGQEIDGVTAEIVQ